MTKVIITKDKFNQYESIRISGITNMFDVKRVISLSNNLTREETFNIMRNYIDYHIKFNKKGGDSNEDNS